MKKYFVTGIGTDVGKTVFAAILVNAIKADYWKPVQSGSLDFTDTDFVKSLSSESILFHKEAYRLNQPLSPHASAKIDQVQIKLENIYIPETKNNLVIEGAGGVMVPLNDEGKTVLDLIVKLDVEVIVVSRHYLGSINHTLLTLNALAERGIKIAGIVFNGEENFETENIILKISGIKFLGRIEHTTNVDKPFIQQQISRFDWKLLA